MVRTVPSRPTAADTHTRGPPGLVLALGERPDLIVLDIMLPNRDGFSLLEELVSTPLTRDVPVVLLAAKTRPQDRARAWGCGASGYITKPFTPATLSETVRLVARMSPEERSAVRDQALTALTRRSPATSGAGLRIHSGPCFRRSPSSLIAWRTTPRTQAKRPSSACARRLGR
jgi:DNA-binding response OmpR family regulator